MSQASWRARCERIPLLANVVADTALDRPELRILPRMDLAIRYGVSTESLSRSIRVATIGDVEPALAKFDTGDRLVPSPRAIDRRRSHRHPEA